MPNQGYPDDNPAFPGRETAEPAASKSPVQYVVYDYEKPATRKLEEVATRKLEVTEVPTSVADGILKNAAGSTAEITSPITETENFPFSSLTSTTRIRSGILRLQQWITAWAIQKGWLVPGQPRELLHQLMLVVSELSEACEAHREGNPKCTRPNMGEFSHIEEELADAVIRILQIAGEHNFRVAEAIIAKMEFNETRPVKHGKIC